MNKSLEEIGLKLAQELAKAQDTDRNTLSMSNALELIVGSYRLGQRHALGQSLRLLSDALEKQEKEADAKTAEDS